MSSEPDHTSPRKRSLFSFSLSTLLLLMLLVSVYLAGWYANSDRLGGGEAVTGVWEMRMPSGHLQPTNVSHLEDDLFVISSRASVMNGKYRLKDNQLVMAEPADARMTGLTWRWDGKRWLLVNEPANTPTGSSYLGSAMTRPSPDPAAANTAATP